MEEQILELLGREDYVPLNVPELLRALHLPPNRQQDLQRVLFALEQEGRIVRTKGNRYIEACEADLIPGKIRINRGGERISPTGRSGDQEIMVPGNATGTALHEDRVLVRRDVKPKGLSRRGPTKARGRSFACWNAGAPGSSARCSEASSSSTSFPTTREFPTTFMCRSLARGAAGATWVIKSWWNCRNGNVPK